METGAGEDRGGFDPNVLPPWLPRPAAPPTPGRLRLTHLVNRRQLQRRNQVRVYLRMVAAILSLHFQGGCQGMQLTGTVQR